MTVSVRPADCESESRELVALLQMNLPQLPHGLLFPWLYLRNPEGKARVWVAVESEQIVGMAAAFPRRFYWAGEQTRGYVLGDFCIHPRHRSLGAALALQRACMEGLSGEDAAFAFDFPSRTMLAVYQRMRIEASHAMVRYAKPLRADRKIAQRVRVPAVAQALSGIVNAGLRWRDNGTRRTGCGIAVEAGRWQEEFTESAKRWSSPMGICVGRTAEYLNWRYGEHPHQQYQMLTARQDGTLRGYLIYHRHGEDCTIDDLLAEDDSVGAQLLTEASAVAREQRVQTLSAPWLSTHSGRQLLERCGFRTRELSPVVLLTLPGAARLRSGVMKAGWHLTHGDWES
jgi:hypothetical protein